jgi:hypothetical protein
MTPHCLNEPIEPLDLANMRAKGVRSLDIPCNLVPATSRRSGAC